MKLKNKNLIMPLVLLLVVVISSGTATFAYFTSSQPNYQFDDFQITAAKMGRAYAQSGSEINLLVKGEHMTPLVSDINVPAATSINNQPFIITLETTDSGGTLKCNYDIVYEASVPFYNSTDNINNANEFTIKGYANINGDVIPETSLSGVTEEILLVENVEIELSGVNKKKTQEWTFVAAFYNQNFNQDQNQGITFGGNIILKNLECTNDYVNS